MSKSDLHPPHSGPASDPVLFGVAAGLAELFPPIRMHLQTPAEHGSERDADPEPRDEE